MAITRKFRILDPMNAQGFIRPQFDDFPGEPPLYTGATEHCRRWWTNRKDNITQATRQENILVKQLSSTILSSNSFRMYSSGKKSNDQLLVLFLVHVFSMLSTRDRNV